MHAGRIASVPILFSIRLLLAKINGDSPDVKITILHHSDFLCLLLKDSIYWFWACPAATFDPIIRSLQQGIQSVGLDGGGSGHFLQVLAAHHSGASIYQVLKYAAVCRPGWVCLDALLWAFRACPSRVLHGAYSRMVQNRYFHVRAVTVYFC